MVNDPNARPEVELTLKSLHGITWKSGEGDTPEGYSEPPNVTATVAFTGSASNMQVSSSTMCSRTGHLVIESLSMNPDEARQTCGSDTCHPLVATFQDAVEGRNSALPTPTSASSVDSSLRPHLSLRLPSRDPKLPSVPLAEVNRSSRVVPGDQPQVESVAAESTVTSATKEPWRQSVLWSPTGTVMPEIIELNVTLRSEDNTVYQEGIAHLVFFQQGESGITTLDLPVKKKAGHVEPMFTLEPDAYIRVHIAIIKSAGRVPSPTPTTTTASSEWSQEMEVEQKLTEVMDQLKENEDMALARGKAAKLELHEQAAETPNKRWGPPSPMMCAAFDVRKTVQAFGDAFRICDTPKAYNKGFDDHGVKFTNSMMGSTIATRESLEI
jgi:hypothetical protein